MSNLKIERKNQKLTQEEAAALAGISYSMMAQIEQGIKKPSMKTMRKIAKVYKKPIGYLFFEESITNSDKEVKA